MNKKGIVIAGIGLVLLILSIIAGYMFIKRKTITDRDKTGDIVEFPANPKKGDPGYQEKNTTIATTDKGKYSGTLVKIDGTKIFIKTGDQTISLSFNSSEIAVQCTDQDLKGATVVDLKLVTEVKVVTPARLSTLIPVNTPIFVMGNLVNEETQIHTIMIPSAVCVNST